MALAAAAVMAAPAKAQRGLAVEVHGGASAGNYAGAGSDFEVVPRPSFGAGVSYGVTDRLGVYAGVERSAFGCDTGFCAGRGMVFTTQGVDAGVELRLPLSAGPWIRAGLVRHTLRFATDPEEGGGTEGEETSGVGVSAGAGVEVRLGRRLSLTPGLRYVRYGSAGEDGVAVLIADVGFEIRM